MAWLDFFRRKPERRRRTVRTLPGRREFKGAAADRLNFNFGTVPFPLDYDLKRDLVALTTRARWLSLNDDYVRRYMKVARNNIIGPRGIELRAQYMSGDTPNQQAIDAVESAWTEWSVTGVCDTTGKLSWVDCQNLFIDHMARDGEALVLIHPRGMYGTQIQFLDPLSLGVHYNDILSDSREVVMGVEIDRRFRRPTAYYIQEQHSNQPNTVFFEGKNYRRIPANLVLHCYRAEQVFQTRGYSPLASAIQRLKMLNGYEEAALVAARAGAAKMGFYSQTGDIPYEGDDEDADGALLEDFEAGVMTKLPPGWDIKSFDTGYPNTDHSDYVKSVLRGIASGIGVSYNTLANDLEGVNFSSIRAGVLEDREEWKGAQAWVARSFCQPIFEQWLDRALYLGRIRNKGNAFRPERFDEFKRVTWQGRRWDWVDPYKDMQANESAIRHRIRSISDVIRERGQDPEEVFREIAQEQERLKSLGIEVNFNDGNSVPNAATEDAESE